MIFCTAAAPQQDKNVALLSSWCLEQSLAGSQKFHSRIEENFLPARVLRFEFFIYHNDESMMTHEHRSFIPTNRSALDLLFSIKQIGSPGHLTLGQGQAGE